MRSGANVLNSCRSLTLLSLIMLKNAPTLALRGVDAPEIRHAEVQRRYILSTYPLLPPLIGAALRTSGALKNGT